MDVGFAGHFDPCKIQVQTELNQVKSSGGFDGSFKRIYIHLINTGFTRWNACKTMPCVKYFYMKPLVFGKLYLNFSRLRGVKAWCFDEIHPRLPENRSRRKSDPPNFKKNMSTCQNCQNIPSSQCVWKPRVKDPHFFVKGSITSRPAGTWKQKFNEIFNRITPPKSPPKKTITFKTPCPMCWWFLSLQILPNSTWNWTVEEPNTLNWFFDLNSRRSVCVWTNQAWVGLLNT